MKFSVVTISYNQAEFLERTIQSVLTQAGVDIEYIVVDAGSSDGSREIIESYRGCLSRVIFEADDGPADGLNKGFSYATGTVFCYLNSDDTLEPGALAAVARYLEANPSVDVCCGHAWLIDRRDRRLRRVWSEPYRRAWVAHGVAVQVQPSTFIRKGAFAAAGGFNPANRRSWDGELLMRLFLSGACISIIPLFLSNYRLHSASITNTGVLEKELRQQIDLRFERLMGRPHGALDVPLSLVLRVAKHACNPIALMERLRFGTVYRRGIE